MNMLRIAWGPAHPNGPGRQLQIDMFWYGSRSPSMDWSVQVPASSTGSGLVLTSLQAIANARIARLRDFIVHPTSEAPADRTTHSAGFERGDLGPVAAIPRECPPPSARDATLPPVARGR